MQRRIIVRFLKLRIIGLAERFVIREQIENQNNNIRVIESVYQEEGRKRLTRWREPC